MDQKYSVFDVAVHLCFVDGTAALLHGTVDCVCEHSSVLLLS